MEDAKVQVNASPGRAVLADLSFVLVKALAGGFVASLVASGLVLLLVGLGG